jgi:hypothetical protein
MGPVDMERSEYPPNARELLSNGERIAYTVVAGSLVDAIFYALQHHHHAQRDHHFGDVATSSRDIQLALDMLP